MEDFTGFSMKDCLSLRGLRWKYYNSLGSEEDEPIYTYNDRYMRWFVRQSNKKGRVCAFNHYYDSKNCDDILNIISEKIKVRGKIYDLIEVFFNCKNKQFRVIEKE